MPKIKLTGNAMWAKLRPEDRDMGDMAPEHIAAKIKEADGVYSMNLFFDEEVTRKDLIQKGVPHKGMIGQLIKEDDEGNLFYKCKRNHQRVAKNGKTYIFGPPKVTDEDGSTWDFDSEGLVGNGSRVEVTLDIWTGGEVTLVSMESVKVLEQIKYDPDQEEQSAPVEEQKTQSSSVPEDEIPFNLGGAT